MTSLNNVVIDPDGDLTFRTPTSTFKVCSAALRRASPVLKAMLFGPWKVSKPSNGTAWVVDLREDSDVALAFILPIIHGQLRNVPRKLDDMGKFRIRCCVGG